MSDVYEVEDTLDVKTAQGHVFTIELTEIYESERDTVEINYRVLGMVY